MMRTMHTIIFSALALSSCQTVEGWFSTSPDQTTVGTESSSEPSTSKSHAPNSTTNETELKIAKLWAKVDELEDKVQRQQESIRVIEKSFALGLTPGGISAGNNEKFHENDAKLFAKSLETGESRKSTPPKSDDNVIASAPTPTDLAEFEQGFSQGHEFYRLGNYGQAMLKFDELRKKYGENISEGVHVFWIGKCWYSLKEYETAKNHLQEFITKNPSSTHLPRAKFELAKTLAKQGQPKKATDLLREIIKNYPYEEAAEMAKMELQSIQQKL